MSTPVSSVSGIASGIQWQDMVSQIMANEQAQSLDPVVARQNKARSEASAWTAFQGVLSKFNDAAATVQNSASFDVYSATSSTSATSSRNLVSVSASSGASPGSFSVEVTQLARAEKLSGNVVTSSTTALGLSGQFALNGVTVSVAAGDTLAAIRDKINAGNSGTSPSMVSATIVSSGTGSRLVLTSDITGAGGIQAVDDADGTLQALGVIGASSTANITANGATQTNRVWVSTAAFAAALGIALPSPSTLKIGGHVISVDLSADSLSTIAAKINAATGDSTSASIVSETVGSKTAYRLVTNASVEADNSVDLAASNRTLAVLGFTTGSRDGVTEILKSANTFGDSISGLPSTTTSLLTSLQVGGWSLGVGAGDTLYINGTTGTGAAITKSFTIGSGTTVQDLLDAVNSNVDGFGGGARTATASLSGGVLALTDSAAGESLLSLSLTVAKAGGGTISLGGVSTVNGGTLGRSRQLSTGIDAQVRIDGQVITRASNTISDAMSGVTLNLLTAEPGTTINVSVTRNVDALVQTVQSFAAAYNNVRKWVDTNTKTGGGLANNSSVKVMASSLTSALLNGVVGASGGLTTAAMAGLQHDKNGVLSLDTTIFNGYVATNFTDVRRLFATTGTPSDAEVTYIDAGSKATSTATPYPVVITQPSTMASTTGAVWTTYATAGTPDMMTFNDAASGVTGNITIANGDTISSTVSKLNAMFAAQKLRILAEMSIDNRLSLSSLDYGSHGGFTVSFAAGVGGDGTAALGITAQAYTGFDVSGTINGVAGIGKGQFLTGATGDATEGIIVRYTGTTARTAGTLAFSTGVGGLMATLAKADSQDVTGAAATQSVAATERADNLQANINDIQNRLDRRKATLTAQFIAMESAMSKAQSISASLSSQILGLQNASK